MANEIQVTASLNVSKGGATIASTQTKSLNMSGTDMILSPITVGTSAAQISFGDISGAPAVVLFKNLDATNYIEIALDNAMSNKFIKLLPGMIALVPLATGTIYAKANTAACQLLRVAAEA